MTNVLSERFRTKFFLLVQSFEKNSKIVGEKSGKYLRKDFCKMKLFSQDSSYKLFHTHISPPKIPPPLNAVGVHCGFSPHAFIEMAPMIRASEAVVSSMCIENIRCQTESSHLIW